MTKNRFLPAIGIFVSAVLLCAHAALNAVFKNHSDAISYVFFIVWSLLALCVLSGRAISCPPGMRRNWGLVSLALLLWVTGTIVAAHAQFFLHASNSAANFADFFYFFYGVPMLLAIASPDDRESNPVFFWLDGIQAAGVGFLAYIALFGVLPFSGVPLHPISVQRLVWIYDVEDVVLALFATARLLASPRGSTEQGFFRFLASFLWVYAVCASIYNHIVANVNDAGLLDVLVDLPFVLLVLAVTFSPVFRAPSTNVKRRNLAALFIDNARPVLLGLSLVALGAWVAQQHFDIAFAAVFGAFVVYGVRATMLQSRFSQTETALEGARERLEQLVLQDGLTGIANRRCFDQRFSLEWARARRAGTPLSLLLIDIDHFKKLNDTYGHLIGDECLIQVARTLQKALSRPGDLLARYGGEEFIALLPETDDSGAVSVAERLQDALSRTQPLPTIESQVTVSIGGTTWVPIKGSTAEIVLDTADRALYIAKQNGRNRTEYLSVHSK